MIITETVSSPVITNIPAAPSRFKIKASAKAFKILSSFYSEPILAIPRELGANAWDSHVAAKNTGRMFEVHAPNQLEPWFSVRDYGTGLSPEQIDSIYTTYFESTKTSDNNSDGCMGLGSKTPFNYADNFNVTSWFAGKKHVYNCFIDETGSPNIMPVATENSTEHTGLEVKFAVKISDISMWVDKITRAYAPFRNRPIITGATINYPARTYIYEGKNKDWGYRKYEGYSAQRGTNAFMGNYCYPVSLSAIRSAVYEQPDSRELISALEYGYFDFFFDIGQLEVAPNKEQLQYEDNNSTTLAIIAAVRKAVADLRSQVVSKMEVPKTRWEAMGLYIKYNHHNSEYASLRSIISDLPVVFNGEKITRSNASVSEVMTALKITTVVGEPYQMFSVDSTYGKLRRTTNYDVRQAGRGTLIFYTNGETVKNARIRHYLNSTYPSNTGFPICYVITDMSKGAKNFHAHKNYFGWDKANVTILEIESLPKPPPAARAKKSATTDEVFVTSISRAKPTNKSNGYNVYWNTQAETVDSTKTYYYFDFLWYDPAIDGTNIDAELTSDIVEVFAEKKLNNGVDAIYGINKKNQHLMKVGTWINVANVVRDYVSKNKKEYENSCYMDAFFSEIAEFSKLHRILSYNGSLIKNIKNTDTRTLFTAFVETYNKTVNTSTRKFCKHFYETCKITAKCHDAVPVDIVALKARLKTRYMGLFDIVDMYSSNSLSLPNIINFIDEKS